MKRIFTMNPLIAANKFNIFKYADTMFLPNSIYIIIALFISYYFPIIEKSSINILNILGYFFIILVAGFIKSNSKNLDLLRILLFSLKKAIFRILSLNFLKFRLIYLILIFPILFTIFGDYTYLLLNFGFIFNNIKMLQNFLLNKDDKCLSKIWESYFYILLNDICMLGLIYIFMSSSFLFIDGSSSSEDDSSNTNDKSSNTNDKESNSNGSNPNSNPDNYDFFHGTTLSKQEDGFINVNTTLPVINNELPIIYTDRLIIRAPVYSDIDNYYSLRSQPEAMVDSGRGKPDSDIYVTFNKLERLIKGDKNNVYFFIFLKNPNGTEGDLIGDGGVHNFKSDTTGWPEFGYKFKKEFWGQGYATEFGKTFIKFWQSLPRKNVNITVAPSSIDYYDGLYVNERLTAYTRNENLASQNVLLKIGFEAFKGLKNGLVNWRKII